MPPSVLSSASSHGTNAPVACSEADQVLPMLTTSGPLPDVVAARIRLSRSAQGTTSRFTVIPVSLVNLSSSGLSTSLSFSRLVPWLDAQ